MADWEFILASQAGIDDVGLEDCEDLTITYERSKRSPILTGTLPMEGDAMVALAGHLGNGLPILSGWRNGVLRFRGIWMPMQEEAGEDIGTGSIQFAPYASLQSRFTDTDFTSTDAGHIFSGLITETNAVSSTGIRLGTIANTVNRDRTYVDQNILEAGENLAALADGFDFEFVAVNEGAIVAKLDVFSSQGSNVSSNVVFEYGDGTIGNVASVSRQTLHPINKAVVIGEPQDGADPPRGIATDSASIAKYGMFEKRIQATDGTIEQATLDQSAASLLRPGLIRVVGFQPAHDSFSPWDDFWLGDTVGLAVRHGSMDFSLTPRINKVVMFPFGGSEGREKFEIGIDTDEVT